MTNPTQLVRFSELFTGRASAYGLWSDQHGAKTIQRPVTPQHYSDHLDGKLGLGIVPIQEDGTCLFAAIDIDVYDLNHLTLAKRVADNKLPLIVCKTKSGGAHLFAFFKEPIQAAVVKTQMKAWATKLGYTKSEIFPKQVKVTPDVIGNWINLPYYNSDKTVRYAVNQERPLTLEEFFEAVENLPSFTTHDTGVIDDDEVLKEYPPCLRALTKLGLPEGSRNSGLFNFGVFFKKSNPKDWESQLMEHNLRNVTPSLPYKELNTVVRSLNKTTYQYTCDQEPICSHCDYDSCAKLKFGISSFQSKDNPDTIYHPATITHCRKLNTDPPYFMLEVNGKDISLSSEEFLNFRVFRLRLMEIMNLVVKPLKQLDWEKQVKDLLDKRTEIGAPKDASINGQILNCVTEFLELCEKSKSDIDIYRDLPVKKGEYIVFRANSLKKYMAMHKLDRIADNRLFMLIKNHGCSYKRISIDGRLTLVWVIKYDEFFGLRKEEESDALEL